MTFLDSFDKPFFIDPVTYFLNQPAKNIQNSDGNPRKSYKMLLHEYLVISDEEISRISQTDEKFIDNSINDSNLEQICRKVLDFQKKCFQNNDMTSFLTEYLEVEQVNQKTAEFLIAPYFLIEDDESYLLNKRSILKSIEIHDEKDPPLYGCFTISKAYLKSHSDLENLIISDFPNLRNFIIWISDFDSKTEPLINLIRLKNLILKLSNNNSIQIINLYGDYLSLLLSKKGLTGICSGISSSMKKRAKLSRGAPGGFAIKIYVPELNIDLLQEDFEYLLASDNRFVCDCPKCQEIKEGLIITDPNYGRNYATILCSEKNYLSHFILCRDSEKKYIEQNNLPDLIQNLREKSLRNNSEYSNHFQKWINDI